MHTLGLDAEIFPVYGLALRAHPRSAPGLEAGEVLLSAFWAVASAEGRRARNAGVWVAPETQGSD